MIPRLSKIKSQLVESKTRILKNVVLKNHYNKSWESLVFLSKRNGRDGNKNSCRTAASKRP